MRRRRGRYHVRLTRQPRMSSAQYFTSKYAYLYKGRRLEA